MAYESDGVYAFRGFEVEFKCVEDLIELPKCEISKTQFGDVHFTETENMEYGAANSENIFTIAMPETDCAKVTQKYLEIYIFCFHF